MDTKIQYGMIKMDIIDIIGGILMIYGVFINPILCAIGFSLHWDGLFLPTLIFEGIFICVLCLLD